MSPYFYPFEVERIHFQSHSRLHSGLFYFCEGLCVSLNVCIYDSSSSLLCLSMSFNNVSFSPLHLNPTGPHLSAPPVLVLTDIQ